MTENADKLDLPPFPTMDWSDCDWWEGVIDLAIGRDADLNVTPYDPEASRYPSESQAAALRFNLEHGDRVTDAVLMATRQYYDEIRPRYVDFLGADVGELMPVLSDANELRELIDLAHVHIHPWTTAGIAYVGLQFSCTWDREHGLGVMMHRDRVVDIGGADVSFAWAPDEAEEST
jgi:hypothetical protein